MNKKLVIISLASFLLRAEDNSKISTVLQNCQTIVETMQNKGTQAVQELLENPEMREALLVALHAKHKQ